jgi:hypothetical protein
MLIILIAFVFSRIPFFIWSPITGVGTDAFEYFYKVNELNNGILPKFDIIPAGLPVFLYFIGLFSNELITISLFQNLACLLNSLFLVIVIGKYYPKKVIIASIFISFYLMDGSHSSLDSYILPDSLYISSLLFLSGITIIALKSNSNISWVVLSFSIVLPAIIRSNGLYLYLFVIFFSFYLLKNNRIRSFFFLCSSFILLNLAWCTYNFFTGKVFFISNYARIANLFNDQDTIKITNNLISNNNKWVFTYKMLLNFTSDNNSFYYEMPYRYAYIDSMKMNYEQNDALKFIIDDDLKKLVLKEFYDKKTGPVINLSNYNSKEVIIKYPNKIDRYLSYFKSTNVWLFFIQLYSKVYSFLIKNLFFLLLGIFCYILSVSKLLKEGFMNIDNLLACLFGTLHFTSIVFIAFSHSLTVQFPRYVIATEFFIYLNVVLVLNTELFYKIKTILMGQFNPFKKL